MSFRKDFQKEIQEETFPKFMLQNSAFNTLWIEIQEQKPIRYSWHVTGTKL